MKRKEIDGSVYYYNIEENLKEMVELSKKQCNDQPIISLEEMRKNNLKEENTKEGFEISYTEKIPKENPLMQLFGHQASLNPFLKFDDTRRRIFNQ